MALFEVLYKASVHKDLRALPKEVVARVPHRIEALRGQPLGPQVVKLAGAERLYRLRVGEKIQEEKYSFLRTKELFTRCMNFAYKKFKWSKKPL